MKVLALTVWLLAIAVLVGILRMGPEVERTKSVADFSERSLLIIASNEGVQPRESISRPVIDVPKNDVAKKVVLVAGCSRLGVFPRRDWAERVAVILTNATTPTSGDGVVPAALPSSAAERVVKPWRVQHIGADAYYLQFDAWSIDELASRMSLQRELLRRLLSIKAIPEAC